MTKEKILILSCGTGEGHNSAAKALEENFRERGIECLIADVLTFKSQQTSQKVTRMYATAIKRFPRLFGLIYKLGALYDDMRLPSPIYALNARYAEKLYLFICRHQFTCVVCTHLFAMEAMTAVRKNFEKIRCFGVLTDYTMHPFMKDTSLDGYFVPSAETAKQLEKKGVAGVYCTGIPLRPGFLEKISKEEARKRLCLPTDKKIVAVMTGGAGCGKVKKLCRALACSLDEQILILAFTGRNEKLKRSLDKQFNESRIKAISFTTNVDLYMRAADVVISKSGGLSSTEIAALNVPLVHLKAIPGLETLNLKYFSQRGISVRADTAKQATVKVKELLDDHESMATMLTAQRLHIKTTATKEISDKILTGDKDNDVLLDIIHDNRIPVGEHSLQQDYPENIPA